MENDSDIHNTINYITIQVYNDAVQELKDIFNNSNPLTKEYMESMLNDGFYNIAEINLPID